MKDANRARRIKVIKAFVCVLLALGVYPIALLSVDSPTALKIFIVVNVPLLLAAIGVYLGSISWPNDD